jgi:hypothetical protein
LAKTVGGKTVLALAGVDGDAPTQRLPAASIPRPAAAPTEPFDFSADDRPRPKRRPVLWPWIVGCGALLFLFVFAAGAALLWIVRMPRHDDEKREGVAVVHGSPAPPASERKEPPRPLPAPAKTAAATAPSAPPAPKEKPAPRLTAKELQAAWNKSPAEFFDAHARSRLEIEGIFSEYLDDNLNSRKKFLRFAFDPSWPVTVDFSNPFAPSECKPGQRIVLSGIVEADYFNGVLAGFRLRDCRFIKTATDKPPVRPGR